jgi:hypothetical protein
MTEAIILAPINQEAALKIGEEIDVLLSHISTNELKLSKSYARLGSKLKEVKVNQYWISLGYEKFTGYLEHVRAKLGKERSHLYAILSVAESLLPHISEEKLEQIGISKAHELRRLIQQGGSVETDVDSGDSDQPVHLLDYASDPKTTAKALRVKVNEALHIFEQPKGNWFDIQGFYATPDERKEIEEFWEIGRKVLQIEAEQEHEVRKQVFLASVRESTSSWVVEVENGR